MLTIKEIRARPVALPLERPIVACIATIKEWPLILIDLVTEEGVIGHSYIEPYLVKAMRYLVPALEDLGSLLKGRQVAPVELYDAARKSLHFVGYEGMSMIAASGLDMAAWDALREGREAAALRAARRLGRPGEILQQQRTMVEGAAGGGGGGVGTARRRRLRRPEAAAWPRAAPATI